MKLLNSNQLLENRLAEWARGVIDSLPHGAIFRSVDYNEEEGKLCIEYDYNPPITSININLIGEK